MTSVSAAAAPKPITGELTKPGYTVVALAATGEAGAVRANKGRFRLSPPAARVTMHVRAPDGTYAGPIVVGRDGRRAIVGVRAGARLGEVKVAARKGYAKASKRLPDKSLDPGRTARARDGVPIGAGVFGRVRSRPPRDPILGDLDLDGVEDQLDIDDDGDLILDDVDRATAARASQPRGPLPPSPAPAGIVSDLHLGTDKSANANAPGSTDEKILETAAAGGRLAILFPDPDRTELDCGGVADVNDPAGWIGGLRWCTRGGTGTVSTSPSPETPPTFSEFPECCDGDGDGFGIVPSTFGFDAPRTLLPGTNEIKTGNEVLARFNDASGVETGEVASVLLPYVFATVPAPVSYHDTAGNGATITYPQPPGPPPQYPVAAGGDGQVRLTMTVWRPQRRPTSEAECSQPPAEQCTEREWIDIGGLTYSMADEGRGPCQPSAYSEDDPTTPGVEDDPNLTLATGAVSDEGTGFTDTRDPPDQPANPAATLTFTVNLTQCTTSPSAWNSGETRRIRLVASPPPDPSRGTRGKATQILEFTHE